MLPVVLYRYIKHINDGLWRRLMDALCQRQIDFSVWINNVKYIVDGCVKKRSLFTIRLRITVTPNSTPVLNGKNEKKRDYYKYK